MAWLQSRTSLRTCPVLRSSLKTPNRSRLLAQIRFMTLERFIVKPEELQAAFDAQSPSSKRIIPLSAAWFLPNDPQKRTGWASYVDHRLPDSRFFDLDKVADTSSSWPHMLPNRDVFAKSMGNLGITRDDAVVVYDTPELGIFSAPRVAWTLKTFGHASVHLLNNFKIWVQQGRPVESGDPPTDTEPVEYNMSPSLETSNHVASFEEMKGKVSSNMDAKGKHIHKILDARAAGRWHGTSAEPRPGMPSGHMPGSINLPFTDVLDAENKSILPVEQLRQIFRMNGISAGDQVISSCGTGVTAAVIHTAMEEAGIRDGKIYDGSWTEWASRLKPEDGWIEKSSG